MAKTTSASSTSFTMPSDREVEARRVFVAPRTLVWEAHTNPALVKQWLLGPEGWTMPICEMDVRPGGAWRYLWRGPDGTQTLEMRGVYREVVPPRRLVNTTTWGGTWPDTLDSVELTEEGGKTTLVSRVLYPSKESRDAALATGMEEGWSASYDRLEEFLAQWTSRPQATELEQGNPP